MKNTEDYINDVLYKYENNLKRIAAYTELGKEYSIDPLIVAKLFTKGAEFGVATSLTQVN